MIRFLAYGDSALLCELPDLVTVLALNDWLRGCKNPQVLEVVPAARTVLVRFDPVRSSAEQIRELIQAWRPGSEPDSVDEVRAPLRIFVRYSGADLAETAARLHLSSADLIAWHLRTPWVVAFTGFAPGFGYLVPEAPGGPRYRVPRRAQSRTEVPAGAVALAAEYCGIYPRASPGGWQIIGYSSAPLWDPARPEPALLRAGCAVQFVAEA